MKGFWQFLYTNGALGFLAISIAIFLGACSGGGGGGGASNTGLTGQFIDSSVANLSYESKSYSGITDSEGKFKYKEGEIITFKLGDAFIGRAFGSPLLTPYDLEDENSDTVDPLNLALLLQSLDSDTNPENGIELPTTNLQALPASIDFSSRTNVEQQITDLSFSPIEINQVETHLVNSVSNVVGATIPPGRYSNTINQSYVRNDVYPTIYGGYTTGKVHPYYLDTCTVEFSSADFEVFESSIAGTIIGTDGTEHPFDLPKELFKEHATDTGVLVSFWGRTEYMQLVLRQPGSDCYTTLWFDRVNGEVMPPVGRIGFKTINLNLLRAGMYGNDGIVREPFVFNIEDRDGWLTSATLAWSQAGGGSGVIDLLTESADVEHFKHRYETTTNVVTGEVSEYWYGYGIFEGKYSLPITGGYSVLGYEHYNFNQSGPRKLSGVGVVRGIEYESPGNLIGDLTLTFKVTDNNGKSLSESYLIKPDWSPTDSGTGLQTYSLNYPDGEWYSILINGEWVADKSCLEFPYTNAEPGFIDPSYHTYITSGSCAYTSPYVCYEQVSYEGVDYEHKYYLDDRDQAEAQDTCEWLFEGVFAIE